MNELIEILKVRLGLKEVQPFMQSDVMGFEGYACISNDGSKEILLLSQSRQICCLISKEGHDTYVIDVIDGQGIVLEPIPKTLERLIIGEQSIALVKLVKLSF